MVLHNEHNDFYVSYQSRFDKNDNIEAILVVEILYYISKDVGLGFSAEDSEERAFIAEEPHKSQT